MKRLPILILSVLIITHTLCLAQSQRNKGYPERGETLDVLPGFQNPPKGGQIYETNPEKLNAV